MRSFNRAFPCNFSGLQKDFLDYLDGWEKEVSERQGVSKPEKKRMCLSRETLEGLRITGKFHI